MENIKKYAITRIDEEISLKTLSIYHRIEDSSYTNSIQEEFDSYDDATNTFESLEIERSNMCSNNRYVSVCGFDLFEITEELDEDGDVVDEDWQHLDSKRELFTKEEIDLYNDLEYCSNSSTAREFKEKVLKMNYTLERISNINNYKYDDVYKYETNCQFCNLEDLIYDYLEDLAEYICLDDRDNLAFVKNEELYIIKFK